MIALIGKILLCTLIVAVSVPLAAVLLLLFAPVRYMVAADGRDVTLRLSWFLGFLRITYFKHKLTAKVFWFRTLGKSKSPPKKTRPKQTKTITGKVKTDNEKTAKEKTGSGVSVKDVLAIKNKGQIVKYAAKFIKRCVKALKPREFDLDLTFGFENPAYTGYLLGILGIIQGVWGIRMSAAGNFDEEQFNMRLYVKDTLALWSLAWPFAALCLKRPVRAIIKRYLRKDDTGERSVEPEL